MFNCLKRKRKITDLEKNQIIIEYLNDKIEAYGDVSQKIEPVELLKIIVHYEERKRFFMTNKDNYNYATKKFREKA